MPLGPLAEELIKTLAEFLGEIVIRWPGQKLCQCLRRDVALESPWAFWAGLMLWAATMTGAWLIYSRL